MSDRPIIFSGPMVRALLEGRKTQTRRLAWRAAPEKATPPRGTMASRSDGSTPWQRVEPGDRLWVRENWKPHSLFAHMKPRDVPTGSKIFHQADEAYAPSNTPWVPSIHMPRWASRLTLTVTDVRIEHLQMIRDADAIAEGVAQWVAEREGHGAPADETLVRVIYGRPHMAFRHLWESLHGADAWEDNPEVVALTFTVARRNIDAKEAA